MSYKQLTQQQRYQLYRMNYMDLKQKDIAQILGVSASTISRELRRNVGKRGTYLKQAHHLSRQRRYKPKSRISPSDWALVLQYLKLDSPQNRYLDGLNDGIYYR